MRLGFGLITCQRYPGDARSDADLYREALLLAEDVERLGLDSVWVSEHHFLDDAYMPALLPVCAAIAARTERVEIGTGVVLAPLYEAVRLAEDAATVDLLANGRFVLGLGKGWREEELEGLDVPRRGLTRALEERIQVLREAWSDGLVSSRGVAVTPKPARPGGPPIWLGASAEPAVRRAGRLADGFMATNASAELFGQQVGWLREELERAGRDPSSFVFSALVNIFCWRERDAWQRVREHVHYVRWKYQDMAGARGRTGAPPAAPPLDAQTEEALRGSTLAGPPDEVVAGLRRYAEAAPGVDLHLIARAYWPGLDLETQRETLRLLAEEVAPQLR